MFTRWVFAALLGLVTVGALTLGVVAPVQAVDVYNPLDVTNIDHLDFETPRNAAAYKTTVPASVIKGASRVKKASGPAGGYQDVLPASSARTSAQISAAARQTKAGAALSRDLGPSVKDWTAANRALPKYAPAIASVTSKVKIPATALSVLGKVGAVAAPASAVMLGAQLGMMAGKGASSAMGLDVDGGICAPAFNDLGLVAFVTDTDCTDFYKLAAGYLVNDDVIPGVSSGPICSVNGACLSLGNLGQWHEYGSDYGYFCASTSGGYWDQYGVFNESQVNAGLVLLGWNPADPVGTVASFSAVWASRASNTITLCGGGTNPLVGLGNVSGNPHPITSVGINTFAWGTATQSRSAAWFAGTTGIKLVEAQGDPARSFRCEITGTDSNVYTAQSASFTEGSGNTIAPACPGLPPEVSPANYKIYEDGGPVPLEVYNEDTTPEYRALVGDHPECATGLCYADLRKVVPGSATGTLSCFDDLKDADCLDWFTDPNKAAVYQCFYAGALTSLAECNHYAPMFDPVNRATGQAYGDPTTGAAAPSGSTTPTADPMNAPIQDPEKPRNCFPTGWAVLNPIEWVVKPVGCALDRAFVPRATVLEARMESLKTSWAKTQPAKIAVAVAAVAPALATLQDGGCGGIPIDLSGIGTGIIPPVTGKFLPACEGDFFHPWAIGIKLFLIGGLTIGGFFALKAQISQLVGLSGSA